MRPSGARAAAQTAQHCREECVTAAGCSQGILLGMLLFACSCLSADSSFWFAGPAGAPHRTRLVCCCCQRAAPTANIRSSTMWCCRVRASVSCLRPFSCSPACNSQHLVLYHGPAGRATCSCLEAGQPHTRNSRRSRHVFGMAAVHAQSAMPV